MVIRKRAVGAKQRDKLLHAVALLVASGEGFSVSPSSLGMAKASVLAYLGSLEAEAQQPLELELTEGDDDGPF